MLIARKHIQKTVSSTTKHMRNIILNMDGNACSTLNMGRGNRSLTAGPRYTPGAGHLPEYYMHISLYITPMTYQIY